MAMDTKVQVRLEPGVKKQAAELFSRLGLSTSDAIRMFINQAIEEQGLPFRPHIPNTKTRKAIQAAEKGQLETINLNDLKSQWEKR